MHGHPSPARKVLLCAAGAVAIWFLTIAGPAYVYLRSKNIVPPSTENAQRGRMGRGN